MTDELEIKVRGKVTITVGKEERVIVVTSLDQLLSLLLGVKSLAVGADISVLVNSMEVPK